LWGAIDGREVDEYEVPGSGFDIEAVNGIRYSLDDGF